MARPDFSTLTTGEDFNQWYWLKAELVDICKQMNLPYSGSKFELRDRIIYALDNDGAILRKPTKKTSKSKFNWAKAELTLATIITDNVSFGPNFRRFMKAQIGPKFSCHGDFMDWMRANAGKTLQDAVLQWELLEARKADPNFRRDIAAYNQYNQYTRDFLDDNPGKTLKEAKQYWDKKKQLPAAGGAVVYERSDLTL
ncbi:MAG: DUF6434 domain-containing protein [Bacteroidota bacterium]